MCIGAEEKGSRHFEEKAVSYKVDERKMERRRERGGERVGERVGEWGKYQEN